MIRAKHSALVSAFVAAALAQSAAFADPQTTTQSTQSTNQAAEQATDRKPSASDIEEVTVTGSRIKRTAFTTPSPVLIITSEETSLEGLLSTTEILQTNTLSAGSQQINDQTTGFVTENGPGANTVALRGIGSSRTLVLLNGRRLSPAGARGQLAAVDLNVIPTSIVQRTEILKDGASSVYGSDAIAGVINLLTNQNLDEGRLSLSGNSTMDSGGETQLFSAAWGKTFDKANISVSYEYFNRDPLLVKDRDFLNCAQDRLTNVTTDTRSLNANTFSTPLDIIDPATGQSKCYNIFTGVARLQGGPNAGADYRPLATAVANGGLLGRDLAGWQRVGGSIATVPAPPPPPTCRPIATCARSCRRTTRCSATAPSSRRSSATRSSRRARTSSAMPPRSTASTSGTSASPRRRASASCSRWSTRPTPATPSAWPCSRSCSRR
jgi:iron complex outermembrane receptor protein